MHLGQELLQRNMSQSLKLVCLMLLITLAFEFPVYAYRNLLNKLIFMLNDVFPCVFGQACIYQSDFENFVCLILLLLQNSFTFLLYIVS